MFRHEINIKCNLIVCMNWYECVCREVEAYGGKVDIFVVDHQQ